LYVVHTDAAGETHVITIGIDFADGVYLRRTAGALYFQRSP
jgi:hypothetical protein